MMKTHELVRVNSSGLAVTELAEGGEKKVRRMEGGDWMERLGQ